MLNMYSLCRQLEEAQEGKFGDSAVTVGQSSRAFAARSASHRPAPASKTPRKDERSSGICPEGSYASILETSLLRRHAQLAAQRMYVTRDRTLDHASFPASRRADQSKLAHVPYGYIAEAIDVLSLAVPARERSLRPTIAASCFPPHGQELLRKGMALLSWLSLVCLATTSLAAVGFLLSPLPHLHVIADF